MRQISWCITLKNRCQPTWEHTETKQRITLPLLGRNLTQLFALQEEDEHWEICISDWKSTDANVSEYINKIPRGKGKVDIKITTIDTPGFSRGVGLNKAFEIASFDNIFFLDADMLFGDRKVIEHTYMHLKNGKVYFPVCISYRNIEHTSGWCRTTGSGNAAITREDFLSKPGGWMERYSWGKEDGDIMRFFKRKDMSVRDITKTFFHQWHPTKMHIHLLNGHEWELI